MKFNLRPYQLEAVELLRQSIRKGFKRPILGLPTGAGKTVTFCHLIESALAKGPRVGIVCHRKELIDQARKTVEAYGLPVDQISFGMVQTFVRSPHKIPPLDLCIIDECHIGNFKRFVQLLPSTVQVVGVTATPIGASKKRPLNAIFDDVVYPVQIKELIDQGYLSKPEYHIWKIDESALSFDFNGEFTAESQARVFSLDDLDEAINRRVGKTIIFTSSIAQTKAVFERCPSPAFMVHSRMSAKEREDVVSDYLESPSGIMVNCGILTAGFDDPTIETVIIYRATTSLTLWLQMVGRGSRIIPNRKDTFRIYDLGNNAERLLAWEANKHWREIFLLQGRKLKDKAAPMKKCIKCEAIMFASSTVCPYCQTKQPVKTKEEIFAERIEVISDYQELPTELKKPHDQMTVSELLTRAKYGSPKTGKPYTIYWVVNQLKKRSNFEPLLHELANIKGYKQGWIYRQL